MHHYVGFSQIGSHIQCTYVCMYLCMYVLSYVHMCKDIVAVYPYDLKCYH